MNASPMPLPPAPAASAEPAGASSAASASPVTVPAKAEAKPADNVPAASETDATAKDKAATVAVGEKRVDSLVDKPSASPSEATRSADKDKSRYIVQVAAVSNKAKVDELLQKLKRGGIEGYWQKVSTKEGERFRVRVGPFSSREEAEKMSKRIDKLGLPGTVQAI
jgi:DedD protein